MSFKMMERAKGFEPSTPTLASADARHNYLNLLVLTGAIGSRNEPFGAQKSRFTRQFRASDRAGHGPNPV